jgi:hypothetical protein
MIHIKVNDHPLKGGDFGGKNTLSNEFDCGCPQDRFPALVLNLSFAPRKKIAVLKAWGLPIPYGASKPRPFMLSCEPVEQSKHERDESSISPHSTMLRPGFDMLRAKGHFRLYAYYNVFFR